MSTKQLVTVGVSLGRIRKAIFLCCLGLGIGLSVQVLIWSFITFTDIRWEEPERTEAAPLIIQSDVVAQEEETPIDPAMAIRGVTSTQSVEKQAILDPPEPVDEKATLVLSELDATLGTIVRSAKGIGSVGMIALLPLVLLSTLLAASSGVAGSERIISVFNLSIVLGVLILPLGDLLSLPWSEGALVGYERMTTSVEAYRNGPSTALSPLVYFSRFLLLPVACIVGTTLTFLRFSASVEEAVTSGDVLHVDPNIEEEASNIKMKGRGSRSASALDRLASRAESKHAKKQEATVPIAVQASKGDLPKRII